MTLQHTQYQTTLWLACHEHKTKQNLPPLQNKTKPYSRTIERNITKQLKALSPPNHTHSISHSNGYVALLSSSGTHFGIDIEYIKPRNFIIWHEWVLNPEEIQWIQKQAVPLYAYYAIWTMKESLIKATHLSLADIKKIGLIHHSNHFYLNTYDTIQRHAEIWLLNNQLIITYVYPSHQTPPIQQRLGILSNLPYKKLWQFNSLP